MPGFASDRADLGLASNFPKYPDAPRRVALREGPAADIRTPSPPPALLDKRFGCSWLGQSPEGVVFKECHAFVLPEVRAKLRQARSIECRSLYAGNCLCGGRLAQKAAGELDMMGMPWGRQSLLSGHSRASFDHQIFRSSLCIYMYICAFVPSICSMAGARSLACVI